MSFALTSREAHAVLAMTRHLSWAYQIPLPPEAYEQAFSKAELRNLERKLEYWLYPPVENIHNTLAELKPQTVKPA